MWHEPRVPFADVNIAVIGWLRYWKPVNVSWLLTKIQYALITTMYNMGIDLHNLDQCLANLTQD